MEKLKRFMLLLFAATAFHACTKDNTTAPANLGGHAYLYDANGVRQSDNSGISVSIQGASVSTSTAADGSWTLANLNAGTYTIVLSKPAFNTVQYNGFNFLANGQSFGSTSLFLTPTYTITNLTDSISGNTIYVSGSFAGSLPSVYCYHLYFGLSANVSSNPSNYFYDADRIGTVVGTSFSGFVYAYDFPYPYYQNNFLTKDTLYVVAYTDNAADISYYTTYNNIGRNAYPGQNPTPSNVAKVVVQ